MKKFTDESRAEITLELGGEQYIETRLGEAIVAGNCPL